VYLHKKFLEEKIEEIHDVLSKFHEDNPLKEGISKEEFKNKIFGKTTKQKCYDELLKILEHKDIIHVQDKSVHLSSFTITYTEEQKRIKDFIKKSYKDSKYSPPKYEEILEKEKNKKLFKMVYDSLIDCGELTKVSEECIFSTECYEAAKSMVTDFIKKNGSITAAEGRDIFNTSRKYAVALLENFDAIKLTRRVEDKRILVK
jgi:selenocysteine-specific elongation factor